ncbi:glycoside hydrolase family 3 protein [Pseudidiomarina taiwanensis]|uniref:Beta-glucosidase n=1 Tax=Pseudidiomarina taiwanensis TaxID=337250 RepID=A0A432ZMW9_9GAMM|nr:glycoside hydrolase family 3 N-terminal domain-containing protein [Pseudidiomarina taiwanensis]RUO79220.1 beta-glucosidase [Pseudidiomarina taiwanensis]
MKLKKFPLATVYVAMLSAGLAGCSPAVEETETVTADSAQNEIWPQLKLPVATDPALEQRIDDMLGRMTLKQKIAQVIQPEIRDITVEDMRKYGFGSYLNGGGAFPNNDKYATPDDWVALADAMYQASVDDSLDGIAIPTMWGTDAVHGHNNVIGATIFPHNIGLGAANNPDLIRSIARATAKEVMATGIDWIFAPTVAVARDDRWGRTYESYSEDPQIVKNYAASIVAGLQGTPGAEFLGDYGVISTVKHFVGDGGTTNGTDQGNTEVSEQELFDIHAQGYVGGLEAGAQTVMASFNSWNGQKIHGDAYLLNDVLKGKMGFDGFVVGDWNGHGQIPGCTNDNCAQAMNAGLDVYMVPTQAWKPLFYNLVEQVEQGIIPMSRLDDAVRRVLRVKLRAGLFDKPSPAARELSGDRSLIGAAEHREIARDAVRQSLVLLKNSGQLLPLEPQSRILVAGPAADNIGQQSGGWTISWQGTGNTNEDFPGGTSIYVGIKAQVEAAGGVAELNVAGEFEQKPDVAIVVFGEQPYAEGNGDLDNLDYQRGNATDLALLQKLKAQGIPVVSIFISGRPLWVNPELNASDAFVAAWLPGSEGAGVADVILRNAEGEIQHDFVGRLPFSWPATPDQAVLNFDQADYAPLLSYGFGLSYGEPSTLADDLPEQFAGATAVEEVVIFERAPQAPWLLELTSAGNRQAVASSIQENGAIRTRTFDDQVQEDARRFEFSGEAVASFSFTTPFPRDLRAFTEQPSALSVTLMRHGEVPAEVYLTQYCGDNCGLRENIAAQLASLPADEWQTVQFPISCLTDAGLDLQQVGVVFGIETDAAFALSINDIRIQTVTESQACPFN